MVPFAAVVVHPALAGAGLVAFADVLARAGRPPEAFQQLERFDGAGGFGARRVRQHRLARLHSVGIRHCTIEAAIGTRLAR